MKTNIRFVLIALMVVAVFLTASAPLGLQEPSGELSEGQLMIVGIVASAIVWLLKVLAQRGYNPPKEIVAIALYVVSFVLAVLFTPITIPSFPPFTDAPTFVTALVNYIGQLLALAAAPVGIAYLIYNVILKRVLDAARARLKLAG